MLTRSQLTGLLVPLVTPLYHGAFDEQSLASLTKYLEPFVDAFVPCLSTGEGSEMSDELWNMVVGQTVACTEKPVVAGIQRRTLEQAKSLSVRAKELGCAAIIVEPQVSSEQELLDFFRELSFASNIPIIVYSVPECPVASADCIRQLDAMESIIGIKDSTGNLATFRAILDMKAENQITLSLLQGLETSLHASNGCDGFLVSLLHLEPDLCRQMFLHPSAEQEESLLECIWKYNLTGQWYVSIKAFLCARGLIRSAEQVLKS